MRTRTKLIAGGVIVLAAAGVGTTVVAAGGGSDSEEPITGDALARASSAALAHVGGGTVTDTEVGDEEGFYEVEVTRADGTQVDVHLDVDFDVLGTEDDGTGDDAD